MEKAKLSISSTGRPNLLRTVWRLTNGNPEDTLLAVLAVRAGWVRVEPEHRRAA